MISAMAMLMAALCLGPALPPLVEARGFTGLLPFSLKGVCGCCFGMLSPCLTMASLVSAFVIRASGERSESPVPLLPSGGYSSTECFCLAGLPEFQLLLSAGLSTSRWPSSNTGKWRSESDPLRLPPHVRLVGGAACSHLLSALHETLTSGASLVVLVQRSLARRFDEAYGHCQTIPELHSLQWPLCHAAAAICPFRGPQTDVSRHLRQWSVHLLFLLRFSLSPSSLAGDAAASLTVLHLPHA
uniref:Putative secreted protein n=1 Tax=Rhipicephalus microplus TaxID=6941 RepID=A0A6G5A048_RHIMP